MSKSITSMDAELVDAGLVDARAVRLPSLAEQPPGLDTAQEARTLRDVEAHYLGTAADGERRIVVPLDGSRCAAAALPYAAALAHATAARVSLLAVVEPLPLHAGLPSAAGQEADERQIATSAAYLDSVALRLRAHGLAVTTVVRHGDPASAILAVSEDEACSLIVMGTHGRTGLARLRAGSVAQRVLRHADIPTLVVPPDAAELPDSTGAIAAITVTLDGSALAERALPFAASLAAALAAPLRLLRVITIPVSLVSAGWDAGYFAFYPSSVEQERDEEHAVETYLEGLAVRLRAPGLEVHSAWVRGATSGAAGAIAEHLAQRPGGIAVMASHGRGGVLRWALGSTTEGVIDRAPGPILIVRAGTTTGAGREQVPDRAILQAV